MIAGQQMGGELTPAIQAKIVVTLEQRAIGQQRHAAAVAPGTIRHCDDRADPAARTQPGARIGAAEYQKALVARLPAHKLPRIQRHRCVPVNPRNRRSEEHTSELQSLMRNSYAAFCLKKKTS